MTGNLRLAIVGCGDIAGFTAIFARLNPKITLSACCDRDPNRAAGFARKHRIPAVYTDYAEMLASGGFDAVYLAVPHDLHLEMSRDALARDLAVLLEKPLAARLSQGIELATLAERPSARLAVNYQYRYESACFTLASALRSGSLGKVQIARINVPWRRETGYFSSAAGWHASRERSGGGTLLTQASHFLDLCIWACESPPARAQALVRNLRFQENWVEVEDLAMGTVELRSGALIQVCSSMNANPEQPVSVEVYAERGTLIYQTGLFPMLKSRGMRIKRARLPVRGVHALQRSLEAFRRYAQGGEPHLVTAGEALKALSAVDAMYRSARSGGWEEALSSYGQ
jgi:UDP-N-acetyl-2-amino-2-deoxyglucuronate dehydrogenase